MKIHSHIHFMFKCCGKTARRRERLSHLIFPCCSRWVETEMRYLKYTKMWQWMLRCTFLHSSSLPKENTRRFLIEHCNMGDLNSYFRKKKKRKENQNTFLKVPNVTCYILTLASSTQPNLLSRSCVCSGVVQNRVDFIKNACMSIKHVCPTWLC